MRYITAQDGTHHLVCQGEKRFRVLQCLEGYPFHVARVQPIEEGETADADIEARAHNLMERAVEIRRDPDAIYALALSRLLAVLKGC